MSGTVELERDGAWAPSTDPLGEATGEGNESVTSRSTYCGTTTGYAQGCRCEACREASREYARRYKAGVRVGKGRPMKPTRHGTITAYTKRGCRCDECRAKWRDHQREYKREVRALRRFAPADKPPLKHGRLTSYRRHGCRCDPCRAVNAAFGRACCDARKSGRPVPPPSVCEVCDRNFWSVKSGTHTCSPRCSVKRTRHNLRQRRVFTGQAVPANIQAKRREREREAVAAAAAANAELAALIEEQERDERTVLVSQGWVKSLDAMLADDGSELHELVASDDPDPARILIDEEQARLIREAIGNRTEEDIQRLDYHTQEWLAAKLRDAGLAAIPVLRSERERLLDPIAHSGTNVTNSKSYGGRAKRREKVAANRHSRPSRKPRKRWTRDDWEAYEAAS